MQKYFPAINNADEFCNLSIDCKFVLLNCVDLKTKCLLRVDTSEANNRHVMAHCAKNCRSYKIFSPKYRVSQRTLPTLFLGYCVLYIHSMVLTRHSFEN